MRKGTLFLSAILSTFMLAVMAGAVSAYQKTVKSSTQAGRAAEAVQVQNASAPLTAPDAPVYTAEQAAALAAQVLGHSDLYSVESTVLDGASVYLVTLSSGDLVYVSPDGQIVSISKIVPQVVSAPADQRQQRDDSSSISDSSNGEHHEDGDHDEHEEGHDDHDDHDDKDH